MANSRLCSISGCDKPALARGWCNAHWTRWQRHGDPLKRDRIANGDAQTYLRNVVFAYDGDECLIWPHHRNKQGYPVICHNGRPHIVSRLVCENFNGPPPPEHEAAHSCGNGHDGCVTKRHLSWKTSSANHADKLLHGTHNRGERNPGAKLSESDIRQIRELRGSLTQREIALRFNISQPTVSDIQTGDRWAWLP